MPATQAPVAWRSRQPPRLRHSQATESKASGERKAQM